MLPRAIQIILNGLRSHIPPCCILAYLQGTAKGIVMQNLYDVYRPCPKHRCTIGISDRQYLELLNQGICPLPNGNFNQHGDYTSR